MRTKSIQTHGLGTRWRCHADGSWREAGRRLRDSRPRVRVTGQGVGEAEKQGRNRAQCFWFGTRAEAVIPSRRPPSRVSCTYGVAFRRRL